MQQEFSKTQVSAQPYLGVRTKSGMNQLAEVMGELFGEISACIRRQGQQPAGQPFAIYHKVQDGIADLECGIPVRDLLDGCGRVQAGQLPACTAALATHWGPYDQLEQTWRPLLSWVAAQGLRNSAPPWEVYVTDPGSETDPSKWRTDILVPVT